MKKILLSLAAIGLCSSAWANHPVPAELIDVTPTYYKFHEHKDIPLKEIIRTDLQSPAQPSLGPNKFISSNYSENGDTPFTNENLKRGNLMFGAFFQTKQSVLAEGFSTYDFGGNIGNVLILNGWKSELDKAIQAKLGLEATPEIKKMAAAFGGNLQLFWILDHITLGKAFTADFTKIRVRLEINAFNNDMTCTKQALTYASYVDEGNNAKGNETNVGVTFDKFAKDGEWNPYKWMVYEFDLEGVGRVPSFIRTHLANANQDVDNGALLIRSIEIYVIPEGFDDGMTPNVVYKENFNDYTPVEVSLNQENLDMIVGADPVQLEATVTGPEDTSVVWSTEPAETDVVSVEEGLVTALKPGSVKVIATSVADEEATAECEVTVAYDKAGTLTLTHSHPDKFELSGGETSSLTLEVEGAQGYTVDPEAVYTVTTAVNENGHVTFDSEEVTAGEFDVIVKEEALRSESPVLITVKAGDDVASKPVELHLFAAPESVDLLNGSGAAESTIISLSNPDMAHYNVKVNGTNGSEAYQQVKLDKTTLKNATLSLEEDNSLTITTKAVGEDTFSLTPYKAGEYNTEAEPTATPTDYTLSVGSTGVELVGDGGESVAVNTGTGFIAVTAPISTPVAVYAINGALVAQAEGSANFAVAKGNYVVKVGNVAFKVVVK